MLGNDDHAAVDRALQSLAERKDVDHRLSVLRTVAEYWHGPILPNDGLPEEALSGIPAPHPLKWWYRSAGKRTDIMSGQNRLSPPDRLSANEDGLVPFYVENQGCYDWATLPAGDDPPVFGKEGRYKPWVSEGIVLSEHLILACLFEAIMGSVNGASAAWLPERVLNEIVREIPAIPISPWKWLETRFYAGNGAFMITAPNGFCENAFGCSVWVGAKFKGALQVLSPFIDDAGEHIAL